MPLGVHRLFDFHQYWQTVLNLNEADFSLTDLGKQLQHFNDRVFEVEVASRCASRELKFWFSPSSVGFRV